METSYLKAFLELLVVFIPGVLFLIVMIKHTKSPVNTLLLLRATLTFVYALVLSFIILQICIALDITGIVRWASVSISVLLGSELLRWHLIYLESKGNKIAIELLKI